MHRSIIKLLASAGATALLASAGAGVAAAQEVTEPEEEIVVTATKRETAVQDVPVAVTTVSGEQVAGAGVADTERLAQVVPSLFVTSSQQVGLGAQIRMRGVGTATGNPALEGSVGYFVDGVYVARSNTAFQDLVDIERVEVLRGPQGTLFGKNTSAGVISILTHAPSFDFGGRFGVALSDYGGMRAYAGLTGPILGDQLAGSISVQGNVRDGYMEDIVTGADYNDRDRWLARAQLLFEPTEDFSLRFIVDHSERNENSTVPSYISVIPAQRTLIEGLGGTIPNPPGGDNTFRTAMNEPFLAETDDTGYTLIANWETPLVNTRAIIGYRESEAFKNFDSDFTNLDVYRQTDDLLDEVFSAELQFSRTLGNFDLLAGLYYFDAQTNLRRSQLLGDDAGIYFDTAAPNALITAALWEPGRGLVLQDTRLDGEGWSIFTHNIWHVTSRFDVTLGLRYQEETKEGGSTYTYNQASACTQVFVGPGSGLANGTLAALRPASFCAASTPNFSDTYEDDQLTGTLVLSYDITDDIMAYTSYSTGFKAGGINLDTRAGVSADQTFLPESVESYEAGLKTEWFGGAAIFNLAVFQMQFEDFQLNSFNPTTSFVLTNEASVESFGVELEGALRLAEGLWLRGGVLYNEAEYGDDTLDPNLRGRRLSNAPRWSGTLGISYQREIADGWSGFGRLDARGQTEVFTASNLNANTLQETYGTLNARFGVRNAEHGLELAVFGTNVTDERYKTIAFGVTSGFMSYFGEPRIVGIELSRRW